MIKRIRTVVRGEKDTGASAVEYGLLIAGIALLILAVVGILGSAIANNFSEVGDAVAEGPPTVAPPVVP